MQFVGRSNRRLGELLAGVSVAIVAAGCGSGGEQGAITQTVKGYLSALANGNGAMACSELTGAEARQFLDYVAQQDPQLSPTSCSEAISTLSGSLGGDETAKLRNAQLTGIAVTGQSARAHVVGGTTTVHLSKAGGRWYISGGLTGGG